MTPIEKNIIVVDELGNKYEATYPKRAKGLVKNGRARFIGENTICLACPPDQLEDNKMELNDMTPAAETAAPEKYNIYYCLDQIEKIMNQTDYLHQAIAQVENTGEAGAMALGNMVEEREKTNRQLIAFYQQMYDDLKPRARTERESLILMLADQLGNPTLSTAAIQGISKAMEAAALKT